MKSTEIAAVEGPGVWTGADIPTKAAATIALGREEIAAIETVLARLRRRRQSLDSLGRADFALPALTPALDRLRGDLMAGRGFAILAGLPIGHLEDAEIEALY